MIVPYIEKITHNKIPITVCFTGRKTFLEYLVILIVRFTDILL